MCMNSIDPLTEECDAIRLAAIEELCNCLECRWQRRELTLEQYDRLAAAAARPFDVDEPDAFC